MTHPSWREFFTDPAARSQLIAAAKECTQAGCRRSHLDDRGEVSEDPAFCDCPANREMTPLEFAEWIELEVFIAERGAGVRRPDHREHMSDGAIDRHARTRMECASAS
jgi:hypothetical protein